MLKSTRRFTLSTETRNSYGFSVKTTGISLNHFRQNPIMLWNHHRAKDGTSLSVLPLGFWDELKVEGDRITAVPVFDGKDAFAVSIYHKVENGTLRMASAGLVPTKWSDSGGSPVLVESIMKEASITDIGSNPDALAVALYDNESNLVMLSHDSISAFIPSAASGRVQKPLEMSWDELHKSGQLEAIKLHHPEMYRLKFKEQFGKEPRR